ncbi:coagulation factor 5/8 type [Acrocarpospora phusangensis]|uniref:Coagulation factor 5/8 type n=1 Tax=Acrocarpospora phusangensis TaxID=1070424 RepID=A0A919Q610_9ACTN|nr:alpha-(1->3)-arabinofuranosyltransferase [Acrocarpospora phusangensis]GIH22583.1 coagulation factor 5/8 type [Acrocarpospora phusangensis]
MIVPEQADSRFRRRSRLLASCLALFVIAFSVAPERIISETKLDMPINAWGFLTRALTLWDSTHFGYIQNQAYGYLFPMGPFYVAGTELGLPPWVLQRLWMALVLCAAFLGIVLLADALGIGTANTRLIAGFAYALAPHAQALIGVNSSEFLPSALVPWMLIPLVRGAREGTSPRRAAALSALAFVCCGGVNATAELAVLLIPFLYLVTRRRGPRRNRLLLWWLGCTAAASFWWLVPLAIMGRHAFSFMPYTENAAATTGVTSLTNTLRGAANWIGYLPIDGLPWWPAAYEHSVRPWLVVLTALVAGLGLVGLVRRGLPERTFLILLVLAGTAIMVTGHVSVVANPLAGNLRDLFDGTLAVFRNIHKFDALVRLPVALGLAYLPVSAVPRFRTPVAAASSVLLGVTFLPVATVGLAARGSYQEIPGYWREAATWLNQNAGDSMVLAQPGARWGEYLWGRPMDEPLQPLLKVRWASRMIVPWGSAGLTRLLDGIDQRFATGQGSAGLAEVLRRMGVGYVLVRNDLDKFSIRGAWPPRVHEAVAESGLTLVKGFGPVVGDPKTANATTWFNQPYQALEVYRVDRPAPLAATLTGEPLRVTGGPEALLTLADLGLLADGRPVLVGDDPGAASVPGSRTIVTDTLRRRETAFSELRFASSPTLTAAEAFRRPAAEHDLLDPGWDSFTSTARLSGVKAVTASSSASDVTALPDIRDTGNQPFSAVDGDARTSWRSDGWEGAVGEWLQVDLLKKTSIPQLAVAFTQFVGPAVTEVEVETSAGKLRQTVKNTGAAQLVHVPPGATDRVRLTVTRVAWRPKSDLGSRVGITELVIPGVAAGRTVRVPGVTGDRVIPTYALGGSTGAAPGCMQGSFIWTCSGQLQLRGEDGFGFDRTITSPASAPREAVGQTVLTDPHAIETATTFPDIYPHVSASSALVDHPASVGLSAFDGNPKTIWYAGAFDAKPTLTIDFGRRRKIDQIEITYPETLTGNAPMQLLVWADKALRGGYVPATGVFRFEPVTTRKVVLQFLPRRSQAVHIADIRIPGVSPAGVLGSFPVRTMCGVGPALSVNGYPVPTRIVGGTVSDLVNGRPLTFTTCQKWTLAAGENRIRVAARDPYRILSMAVEDPLDRAPPSVTPVPVTVEKWTGGERTFWPRTDQPGYLVVNENFNGAWRARLGGTELTAVRLDGWRQAWILPAGASAHRVTLEYPPETAYHAALATGFLLVMLLVALARWRRPGAAIPAALPAGVPARAAGVLAAAAGVWTGGLFGLLLVLGTYALVVGLRRAPALRAARVADAPVLVAVFLGLAGLSAGLGHYLAGLGQDAVAGVFRDVLAQLLCLPVLGRLAAGLPEPEEPPVPEPGEVHVMAGASA